MSLGVNDLSWPKEGKSLQIVLNDDLLIDQWIIEKGTVVVLYTGRNFGCVALPYKCMDKRGFEIPRQLFKY